jgi:signal transduction histidine kinase/CheY-like chemotaxis protein
LQTALEHVRQGIAVFDTDLQLICWNRRFGEVIDVPPGRVYVGATLPEILGAMAERAGLDAAGRDAFVRERVPHYALSSTPYLERFAERGLVIEVRANRMPDGGIVTMFTDITESVEAAEALERANETLERRVRERTEELTSLNTELAHAKAEADEANLSKTRFLAAAGHDILQPLNAARLYVTSLLEREREREDRRLVVNVDASLEAVEEILNALLDISRLDAGAMKPELTNFGVGDLLRQLELEFTPLAREKDLELVFVPSTLVVRSDRRLLRRLLQNLISNALKYTLRGRVLVGCRRRGERVEIGVYDTGVGIPGSEKRAIFQEFHRLDEGARVARGLGLGLSIVERIGRVLEHEIDFRSVVGSGSHFWVDVPRARAVADAAALLRPRRVETGQLTGMAVLCIDNEPVILDGMATLLKSWGCSVVVASDLRGARAALEGADWTPTGLLIDYHLDEGNGIEAIVALRARYGEELPAILVTADRSPRVREEARARQVKVLNKPMKPAALRALLAQWHARRAVAAE